MKDELSNDELNQLEIWTDDLIIGIFDNKDKRYWINRMLRKAFLEGKRLSNSKRR